MSQTAKTSRDAMKAKAKRLASADPHTKVDSSDWTPPSAENASTQTGMRPLSKRAYKKGGKVIGKAEGMKAAHRADRAPRKSGGRSEPDRAHRYLTPDNLINRDVRMANEAREGTKHIGGLKHGGKAHKFSGGVGENPVGSQNKMMGQAAGMMKKGGRTHKAKGGTDLSYLPIEKKEAPKPFKPFKPTGIEQDYNPNVSVDKNYTGPDYSEGDEQIREMLSRNPRQSPDYPMAHKRGGKTDGHKVEWLHHKKPRHAHGGKAHSDEAEDKKLIKKMVKPSALEHRTHKLSGGLLSRYAEAADRDAKKQRNSAYQIGAKARKIYGDLSTHKLAESGLKGRLNKGIGAEERAQNKMDKAGNREAFSALAKAKIKNSPIEERRGRTYHDDDFYDYNKSQMQGGILSKGRMPTVPATDESPMKRGGKAHPHDCKCHKCWGGKTEKNKGGGVFKGEGYPFKVPGEVKGGRSAHAHGGKAGGKGKMNVNIIIASGHHDKGAMGGQPMPNAPVSPRTPPVGAGAPMPPPGMMPPGGGAPGAGGPPMPPPGMMPRKSGGRTTYPIDSGAGGGEARLEKIKAYGLTPPRKK